jgi:hypothetical protein
VFAACATTLPDRLITSMFAGVSFAITVMLSSAKVGSTMHVFSSASASSIETMLLSNGLDVRINNSPGFKVNTWSLRLMLICSPVR